MSEDANSPKAAMVAIQSAAKARGEIPRFTFGWVGAELAFSVVILREYDDAWTAIQYLAGLSAFALLGAAAMLVVRITVLKQIESLDASELFEGRIPNPDNPRYQKKLADYGRTYRVAGALGTPVLLAGMLLVFATLATVVVYHLVR